MRPGSNRQELAKRYQDHAPSKGRVGLVLPGWSSRSAEHGIGIGIGIGIANIHHNESPIRRIVDN